MTDTVSARRRMRIPGRTALQSSLRSGRLSGPARSASLLIVIVIVFSIITPRFASATNASSLLGFVAPAILIAVAQTFVISLGEIDLSVASVSALSGIVLILTEPYGLLVAFIAALATGLAVGLTTGLVTALLRVPSLVSSLAMLFVAQGIALIIAARPVSGSGIELTILFISPIGPFLTVQTLIVLIIVLIAGLAFGLTPVGRAMLARGSNAPGARALGLPDRSLVIGSFAISGLMSAFAGMLIAIGLNSASPVIGADLLLLGVAACLIGGSRLEGGTGSVAGSALALLALLTLENGLDQFGVSAYLQQVIQGVVVLVALFAANTPQVGGVERAALFRRLRPKGRGPRPDRID